MTIRGRRSVMLHWIFYVQILAGFPTTHPFCPTTTRTTMANRRSDRNNSCWSRQVAAFAASKLPHLFFCPPVHCNDRLYGARRKATREDDDFSSGARGELVLPLLNVHHTAIKTRNITTAMAFYTTLLGFRVQCRFRAGPAKAAWLEFPSFPRSVDDNDHDGDEIKPLGSKRVEQVARRRSNGGSSSGRLELIELPFYMLREDNVTTRQRAPDLIAYPDVLGYNHMAIDVTLSIREMSLNASTETTTTPQQSPASLFSLTSTSSSLLLAQWMDRLNRRSLELFNKTVRVAVPPRQQMMGRSVYELAFIYDADGCLIEFLNHVSTLNQSVESGWEPWNGTDFSG